MEEVVARAVRACQKGNLEGLESALEEGVSPNARDVDGCSLLHWAAINNRVTIVQRLLELGADPNVVGGLLVSSPLHWACRVGHTFSSALLVKAGAVCNVRDAQGYTPIHLAVQSNQSQLVAYLLEKFYYCKDITDNSGMTPAMWAAYRTFGMFPIRLIVRSGANLNAQEHLSGNTALHIAIQECNDTSIRIVSSDPGVIERKSDSRAQFLSDIEQCKQVNYCFTCWVDKPQGAKHCGVCDR
ncbi:unnamed protein product [Angiostrongylus costaricensis]|uniref:ANK_REP_REGION domain-containing protein n=1 Tax=Angiostrongylus costaricensis TaxID=334426 RepID=A0A0R3PF01_ANGCS|nr:unnamed protein product [Angiostrongylus costaricensis]